MFGQNPYYFRTIRSCVQAFGSLFADMVMVKYTTDSLQETSRLTVPLSYSGKENYLTRLLDNPNLAKPAEITLPRASFEITSYAYDPTRKLSTFNTTQAASINGSSAQQYQSVPWNIDFDLFIYVRNREDGLQLVEQILPQFQPDYTVAINYVPQLGITRNTPIILNNVSCTEEYEGDAKEQERTIIWTLGFTMQTQFFGPINTGNVITQTNTNFYIDTTLGGGPGEAAEVTITMANNGFGQYVLNEPVYEGANLPDATAVGYVSAWDNNSGTLVLSNVQGAFTYPGSIVGANSSATWVISTITPDVIIATVTNTITPANANVNSDYGFITTVVEYPQTV